MQDAERHPYLETERGIPAELLMRGRFAGRIRIDARGNAIFPHFDQNGAVCGFEKKNMGFTRFSSSGTKAVWLSHGLPDDQRLVFCESAVDALSHALLFPDPGARYASIGGKLNPAQPDMIGMVSAASGSHHGSVYGSGSGEQEQFVAALQAQHSRRRLVATQERFPSAFRL